MKRKKLPSRKRDKILQSKIVDSRMKMHEKVVPSKKIYKRNTKHKNHEE